jgi:ABC-2 type transport system permease protein
MVSVTSGLQQTLLVAGRNLRRLPRAPEQIGGAIAQPITFTLLFAFVFGHAIHAPGGGNYREYLLGGIMVQVMAFASTTTAAGVAEDMASGLVDRLRSLPIARSAALSGRVGSDLVQRAGQLAVAAALGLLIGWRAHHGVGQTTAAFALLLLYGIAFSWVGVAIGLLSRNVEAANNIGLLWLFPVTFIANTFVPINAIPSGLRVVAEWNPLSAMVAATRQLFGNPTTPSTAWPLQHAIITSIAWSILITIVFATIAIRRYRQLSR